MPTKSRTRKSSATELNGLEFEVAGLEPGERSAGDERSEPGGRVTGTIIPRWEWRMFAERFGAAERRLASFATASLQVSDEQYVLWLRSDGSVEVHDGLMDVKRSEHVVNAELEHVVRFPHPT